MLNICITALWNVSWYKVNVHDVFECMVFVSPGTRWAKRCWQPAPPDATAAPESRTHSIRHFPVSHRLLVHTHSGPRDCVRHGCTENNWTAHSVCRSHSADVTWAEPAVQHHTEKSSPSCRSLERETVRERLFSWSTWHCFFYFIWTIYFVKLYELLFKTNTLCSQTKKQQQRQNINQPLHVYLAVHRSGVPFLNYSVFLNETVKWMIQRLTH